MSQTSEGNILFRTQGRNISARPVILLHNTKRKESETMTDGYFVVRTGIYNDASPISGARIYIRKSRDEALSGQYNPETDVWGSEFSEKTINRKDVNVGCNTALGSNGTITLLALSLSAYITTKKLRGNKR